MLDIIFNGHHSACVNFRVFILQSLFGKTHFIGQNHGLKSSGIAQCVLIIDQRVVIICALEVLVRMVQPYFAGLTCR